MPRKSAPTCQVSALLCPDDMTPVNVDNLKYGQLSGDRTFSMHFHLVNMETRCLDKEQKENAESLFGPM